MYLYINYYYTRIQKYKCIHTYIYFCVCIFGARSRPARHSARLFPFLYINVDINPSIFFSPARFSPPAAAYNILSRFPPPLGFF